VDKLQKRPDNSVDRIDHVLQQSARLAGEGRSGGQSINANGTVPGS